MMRPCWYVRVASNYIKFTKNGEYITVRSRAEATPFYNKADLSRACRKSGITSFKVVANTLRKI